MITTKNHLDAAGWQQLVLDKHAEDLQQIAARITSGYVDPLVATVLAETQAGWHVLETGSGWGSLSATLALRGRLVTLMDWSPDILGRGMSLLHTCSVSGLGVCADLFAPLPFVDKSFDCVWSSGVLEHFRPHEQVRILKESARISRHKVISLVPNAFSAPYRFGKWFMERTGSWEFGYEHPEYSQRRLFEFAGLRNIQETTAHAARSAWFLTTLPMGSTLRDMWTRLVYTWPEQMDKIVRQGYMLVTVGDVD